MNILMVSNSASFHQLAQLLVKDESVNQVYHYGANPKNQIDKKYYPTFIDLPYSGSVEDQVATIINDVAYQKIDLVLTSGLPLVGSTALQSFVNSRQIPYLFPTPNLTGLELNRMLTKQMLTSLNIPCSKGKLTTGWELFRDFFKIPRPFVIKIEKYMHGRQTVVITDDNHESVFHQLFGKFTHTSLTPSSIELDTRLVIEEFVEISYELSYHALLNKTSYSYIGSARDYKRQFDNDTGELADSLGSYYVSEVDSRIHDYLAKIHQYLTSINKPYTGFLFLGIGVATDGVPYVLEINTRPGDPEIATIAASTENFFELVANTAAGKNIPELITNGLSTVSVAVNNTNPDWNNTATKLPVFDTIPDDILFGLAGATTFTTKHSLFTASADTVKVAAKKVYRFLDTQNIGQFYYRKDIGLLK
jgi:phosphoribosylamine--glycine ligase